MTLRPGLHQANSSQPHLEGKKGTMKLHLSRFISMGLPLVVLATGCVHDVRNATAQRRINAGSAEGPLGYAEFYSAGEKAVIPIYQLDNQGSPHLLSSV